jgi:hypothetical protein
MTKQQKYYNKNKDEVNRKLREKELLKRSTEQGKLDADKKASEKQRAYRERLKEKDYQDWKEWVKTTPLFDLDVKELQRTLNDWEEDRGVMMRGLISFEMPWWIIRHKFEKNATFRAMREIIESKK